MGYRSTVMQIILTCLPDTIGLPCLQRVEKLKNQRIVYALRSWEFNDTFIAEATALLNSADDV